MIKLNRFLANFLTEIRNQKSKFLKKIMIMIQKVNKMSQKRKLFGKKPNYSVQPNNSVKNFSIRLKQIIRLKLRIPFLLKRIQIKVYSYSVKTNRNTIFKYSDSSIPKRIVDMIIPIPIRFLITPIMIG